MNEETDLGASKPIAQPVPKPQPLQHPVVITCGHKLDLRKFPDRSNCWECWRAFFESNPEGVSSVHELLLNGGTKAVTAIHGKKFVKAFGKFLQKQLLKQYASKEVQAASGIEGNQLSVPDITQEANLGIR